MPSSYNVLDLGAFSPSAINNASQIAGTANKEATLWQNGALLDLGRLGQGKDLNDAGQVVGSAGPSAFLWDQSSGMHLFTLSSAYGSTAAYGVNPSSQVVGTGTSSSATYYFPHAILWTQSGGIQDINALVGNLYDGSEARAVNQAGQVVGWKMHYIFMDSGIVMGSGWQAMSSAGYVWDSATSTTRFVGQLPGDKASRALAINNLGQVIGTSGNVYIKTFVGYTYYAREAFLWQNGVMTDLGMPSASAINNLGQVVGGKYLWDNGTLSDLNTQIDPSSGWVITATTDINDAGQIVGQGTLNGVMHNFLLSPIDPSAPACFAVSGFTSPTTAGVAGPFTVTALNADGTTASGYTGTIHFASSDAQAELPGVYTFTAADAGVHSFSAALKTAGTQSLTAADATGITGAQGGIMVQAASVSKFAIAGFPTPITAGVAGSFTVTAEDAYGNSVRGYTGTIHFISSDPQAVLPGDYAFTGNSVQPFSTILKTAGTQSIAALDTVMANLAGADTGILVKAAAASRLRITGPSCVSAGMTFSLTVTVLDAYGNVATDYTGTLAFKSSDGSATLPRNYTFTTSDQGVHTFTGFKFKRKGNQTITITDTFNAILPDTLRVNVL